MINSSWRLYPEADVLYGCDFNWWERNAGVAEWFGGLKLSQDPKMRAARPAWGVRRVHVVKDTDRLLTAKLGTIGWFGNSGGQVLNLVVQFGAPLIALVGYDMTLDRGLHWHGPHPRGMNNPTAKNVERWRRVVDDAAPLLRALGVRVLNLAPGSALRSYPKVSLDEALQLAGVRT